MSAQSIAAFALAAGCLAAAGAPARADAPPARESDAAERALADAVAAYSAGDMRQALTHLQAVSAEPLTPGQARALATGPHEEALLSMLRQEALRDAVAHILTLSITGGERDAVDPKAIRGVVRECLTFDPRENRAAAWEAETRLALAGEAAAPVLFEMLKETREQDLRARIVTLAERLGPVGLLPWSECLAARDPDLRAIVLHLVGRLLADNRAPIGARRVYALAQVQAVSEDANAPQILRDEAAALLARLAPAEVQDAATRTFFKAAEAFIQTETPRLIATQVGRLSLPLVQIWTWSAERQALTPLDLIPFPLGTSDPLPGFVPAFAADEIMAQVAALAALRWDPANDAAAALYTCAVYAEKAEYAQVLAHSEAYPETAVFAPTLSARAEALAREARRTRAAGVGVVAGALRHALQKNRDAAAADLLRELATLARGLPLPANAFAYDQSRENGVARYLQGRPAAQGAVEKPSAKERARRYAAVATPAIDLTPLLDALDADNPFVQYQAALALADIGAVKPFHRQERVVPLLARAVGDVTPRVVLVVSPDDGFANRAMETLRTLGFAAVRAADGYEAILASRDFPSKDAILLDRRAVPTRPAGTPLEAAFLKSLKGSGNHLTVLQMLREDVRARAVPTWLVVSADDPEAVGTNLPDAIAGVLERPLAPGALAEALRDILAEPDEPAVNRTALAAAEALGRMGAGSLFANELPEAARVLAGAIRKGAGKGGQTLPDAYRVPFATALGRIGTPAEARICLQVAEDRQNAEALRVATIHAAGDILGGQPPSADVSAALSRLLVDASEAVRAEAAWALGRMEQTSSEAGARLLGETDTLR